jgi:broad specificity phosphatase PhoE
VQKNEYEKDWLKIVRNRLWNFIFSWKNWVENLKDILFRIDIFLEKCKKYKGKNILVITHWFLLTLIKLRLNWTDFENISNINNLNLPKIDFLDWFEI